jgi:seryl-tRNA synthetase
MTPRWRDNSAGWFAMHIQIEADPIGPLKVLPALPDARLATLEGLNGIGKTLSVRLLQACAGVVPYSPDSPAWTSFCEGLGPFTVTITNLLGAEELRWEGDTREWLEAGRRGLPLPFQDVAVDGASAVPTDVNRIFAVYRIAGDEGIIDTLAQQSQSFADAVASSSRRLASAEMGPLSRLENLGLALLEALPSTSFDSYLRIQDLAEEIAHEERSLLASSATTQKRADALARAADLRRQLNEFRQRAPGLEDEIAAVDREIAAIHGRRDALQKEVAAISAQLAGAGPALKELANARRTLERNRANLSSSLSNAAAVATPLGIPATDETVERLLSDLRGRIEELTEQRTELDAAPAVQVILRDVAEDLAAAERRGLGDQIAIDDTDSGLQLTISRARTGMLARRAFLTRQPPPPQAREVSAQLFQTRRLLAQAENLSDHLRDVERYSRLVTTNEERVTQALQSTNPGAAGELEGLERSRRSADERLLELAAARAALTQQLGNAPAGATEEALDRQLRQALGAASIGEDDLDSAIQEVRHEAREIDLSLREVQRKAGDVARELAATESEMRRSTAILRNGPAYAWLRESIPRRGLPDADTPIAQQLGTLDGLQRHVRQVLDRLGGLRAQLAAIEEALRGLGRHLRGGEIGTREYVQELQEWLGSHFSEWFNNERIRHELIPLATGLVSVDIASREVAWFEGEKKRSRPLVAFSSGEQAFAYTRARLAVLDDSPARPTNRLIVLDEFGAFIAHDRLTGLLAYLQERSDQSLGDQVLVVLPLSRDYESLAESSAGPEAERYAALAAEVEDRKYAVQELVS